MTLLITLALFFALTFLWPMLRLHARTGEWGLVSHRGADPCQRLVGSLMGVWLAVVAGWAIALFRLGPAALGVHAEFPRIGWTLISAGLLVILVAQAQMGVSWRIGIDDRPTALATRGLYALVRNPIFSGMLLALGGVVALAPSAVAAVAWIAIAQLIAVQVRLEEQHLERLHGAAYADYRARVGRFVPGLG